jgi:8-oxo-dGTP pyrophosphatase MutT (NUDIX family)
MITPWTVLKSALVFDHPWYKLRQDTVALPDGQIIDDYFVSVRPDVALIFPVTPEDDVIFVRQYRHGVRSILLELPGGTFNPTQETAEAAARRELQEETGYVAQHLTRLATIYDNPNKDTNRIHLFRAELVTAQGSQRLDDTEAIDIVKVPKSAIPEMIRRGQICVAGTIALCFLAQESET